MRYIAIVITTPTTMVGYQEIDDSDVVVRLTDADGVTIADGAIEYSVSNDSPPRPAWAPPEGD